MKKVTVTILTLLCLAVLSARSRAAEGTGEMVLSLLDTQGQPIAGAVVELFISPRPEEWKDSLQDLSSDANGKITIRYEPATLKYLSVFCKTPGYAPFEAAWSSPKEKVPEAYSVTLEKGARIGGFVHDEHRCAIPDVAISFQMPLGRRTRAEQGSAWRWVHTNTDARGFWCCDFFPPEIKDAQFYTTFVSPDHKPLRAEMPLSRFTDDAQGVLSKTVTLASGCPFSGRVLDASGEPIAGAYLTACENLQNVRDFSSKTTNANGEFRFQNLDPSTEGVLIVTAPGFRTEFIAPFAVTEGMEPLKLVMQKASVPLKIKRIGENRARPRR